MEEQENKKTEAAALSYDLETDSAPKVIAKGQGEIAKKIIETAEQHNIPLQEDEDLVKVLLQLELDEEIPEELYSTVAEILSFVLELEELA